MRATRHALARLAAVFRPALAALVRGAAWCVLGTFVVVLLLTALQDTVAPDGATSAVAADLIAQEICIEHGRRVRCTPTPTPRVIEKAEPTDTPTPTRERITPTDTPTPTRERITPTDTPAPARERIPSTDTPTPTRERIPLREPTDTPTPTSSPTVPLAPEILEIVTPTPTPSPTPIVAPEVPEVSPTITPTTPPFPPTHTPTPTPALAVTTPTWTPTVTPTSTPLVAGCPPLVLQPAVLTDSLTFTVSGVNTTKQAGVIGVSSPGWAVVTAQRGIAVAPRAAWSVTYTVPESASTGTHTIQAWLWPSPQASGDGHGLPASGAKLTGFAAPSEADALSLILPGSSLGIYSSLTQLGGSPTPTPSGLFATTLASGAASALGAMLGTLLGCADLQMPEGFAVFQGSVVDARTGVGVSGATVELLPVNERLPFSSGTKSAFEALAADSYRSSSTGEPSCSAPELGLTVLHSGALSALAAALNRQQDIGAIAKTGFTGRGPVLPGDYETALQPMSLAPDGSPAGFGPGSLLGVPTGEFSQSVPAPRSYYVKVTADGYIAYLSEAKYSANRFQLIDLGDIPITRYTDVSAPLKNCAPSSWFLSFPQNQVPVEVHFVTWAAPQWERDVQSMDFTIDGGPVASMYRLAPLGSGGWGVDYNVSPLLLGAHCASARPRFADGTVGEFDLDPATCSVKVYMLETPKWVGSAWAVNEQMSWNPGASRYEFSYKVPRYAFDHEATYEGYTLPVVDIEVIPRIENRFEMGITVEETFTPVARPSSSGGWWGQASEAITLVIFNQNVLNELLEQAGLPPIGDLPIAVGYRAPGGALARLLAAYTSTDNWEPWYSWSVGPARIQVIDEFELLNVPDGTFFGIVTLWFRVDFGIDATLSFSGSIDPDRATEQVSATITPGIEFIIDPHVDVSVLGYDVAEVGAEIRAGLDVPITYRDLPDDLGVDWCFWLSADIYVLISVWKLHDDPGWYIRPFDPFTYDTPGVCHFGGVPPSHAGSPEERGFSRGAVRLGDATWAIPVTAARTPDVLRAPNGAVPLVAELVEPEFPALTPAGGHTAPGVAGAAVQPAQPSPVRRPHYAAPAIAADAAGNALLLWSQWGGRVDGPQNPAVWHQRIRGEERSAPDWLAPFTEGGLDPAVAVLGPNRALAVWTWIPPRAATAALRAELEAALAGRRFEDVRRVFRQGSNMYEIAYALWDGQRWSPSIHFTEDSFADGAPALASDPASGRALLAWVKDLATDPSAPRQPAIYVAEWDGARWSAPTQLYASAGQNYAPSVAYRDGKGVLAWIEDQDGDMATVDDARLMMATYASGRWGAVDPIVGVPGRASSPSVAIDSAGNALIAFSVLGPGPHGTAQGTPYAALVRAGRVDVSRLADGAPGEGPRAIITPDDEALVFFRWIGGTRGPVGSAASASFLRGVGFPDGQRTSPDVAATGALLGRALGDAAPVWGNPRVVATTASGTWSSFSAALTDPVTLYLAAGNAFPTPVLQPIPVPHPDESYVSAEDALNYLRMPYRPNPVVESVSFGEPGGAAGQRVAVEATVTNLGLAPLRSGAFVAFYLDDPGDPARQIARVPLAPTAFSVSQKVSASFISDGQQHLVFAVAMSAEDAERMAGRFDAVAVHHALPAPTNLRGGASPVGGGALLNWNVADDPRVAWFSIWRAEQPAGPYSRVGTAVVPAFLDETAAGRTFYYRVASENASGQASGLSNVASVPVGER